MLRSPARSGLALAALALSGCMLDWNSLRADARAPADSRVEDVTEPMDSGVDTGVIVDSGVDTGVDSGTSNDTGVDSGVAMDTGVDTGTPGDTGVDTGVDVRSDSGVMVPDADPGCTGPVVVNEVQSRSSTNAGHEFVELRNNGTCTVDLMGWRLMYSSAGGSTPGQLYLFVAGDRIAPGEHLVLASTEHTAVTTMRRFNSGIADSGSVAIFNRVGRADSVAFGTLTNPMHMFAEPVGMTGAMSAPPGQSISRAADGRDTDNNAMDFRVTMTPTPGAPNM